MRYLEMCLPRFLDRTSVIVWKLRHFLAEYEQTLASRFRCAELAHDSGFVSGYPDALSDRRPPLCCQNGKQKTEDQKEFSEISKQLTKKYVQVFTEPVPERLADLIRRLKEIETS